MVNLNLAHTLLVAAEEQPSGFLNVRGADLVREVELMAAAGLVDASLGNAGTVAFAVINRVTEQGHAFLRAFKNQPPHLELRHSHPRSTDRDRCVRERSECRRLLFWGAHAPSRVGERASRSRRLRDRFGEGAELTARHRTSPSDWRTREGACAPRLNIPPFRRSPRRPSVFSECSRLCNSFNPFNFCNQQWRFAPGFNANAPARESFRSSSYCAAPPVLPNSPASNNER